MDRTIKHKASIILCRLLWRVPLFLPLYVSAYTTFTFVRLPCVTKKYKISSKNCNLCIKKQQINLLFRPFHVLKMYIFRLLVHYTAYVVCCVSSRAEHFMKKIYKWNKVCLSSFYFPLLCVTCGFFTDWKIL